MLPLSLLFLYFVPPFLNVIILLILSGLSGLGPLDKFRDFIFKKKVDIKVEFLWVYLAKYMRLSHEMRA